MSLARVFVTTSKVALQIAAIIFVVAILARLMSGELSDGLTGEALSRLVRDVLTAFLVGIFLAALITGIILLLRRRQRGTRDEADK